eukprot:Rmarinus@m.21812
MPDQLSPNKKVPSNIRVSGDDELGMRQRISVDGTNLRKIELTIELSFKLKPSDRHNYVYAVLHCYHKNVWTEFGRTELLKKAPTVTFLRSFFVDHEIIEDGNPALIRSPMRGNMPPPTPDDDADSDNSSRHGRSQDRKVLGSSARSPSGSPSASRKGKKKKLTTPLQDMIDADATDDELPPAHSSPKPDKGSHSPKRQKKGRRRKKEGPVGIQYCKITVFQKKSMRASMTQQTELEEYNFTLDEVCHTPVKRLHHGIKDDGKKHGYLTIRATDVNESVSFFKFTCDMVQGGLSAGTAARGGLDRGKCPLIESPVIYLRFSRYQMGQFEPVHRTEDVSNLSPISFKPFNLSMHRACCGDVDRLMLIECMDSATDDILGRVETSISKVMAKRAPLHRGINTYYDNPRTPEDLKNAEMVGKELKMGTGLVLYVACKKQQPRMAAKARALYPEDRANNDDKSYLERLLVDNTLNKMHQVRQLVYDGLRYVEECNEYWASNDLPLATSPTGSRGSPSPSKLDVASSRAVRRKKGTKSAMEGGVPKKRNRKAAKRAGSPSPPRNRRIDAIKGQPSRSASASGRLEDNSDSDSLSSLSTLSSMSLHSDEESVSFGPGHAGGGGERAKGVFSHKRDTAADRYLRLCQEERKAISLAAKNVSRDFGTTLPLRLPTIGKRTF